MVTITNAVFSHYNSNGVAVNVYDIYCLHDDTKPTTDDVGNGSLAVEMDNSKVYLYNEAAHTWIEWGATPAASTASTLSASPRMVMPRPGATPNTLDVSEPDVEQEEYPDEDAADETQE